MNVRIALVFRSGLLFCLVLISSCLLFLLGAVSDRFLYDYDLLSSFLPLKHWIGSLMVVFWSFLSSHWFSSLFPLCTLFSCLFLGSWS
eukprot:NODE_135_length_1415_cov_315.628111_g105_i0.p3 GENE.NODE_135_length_1415_cov_315.628111_g105_i0~~NODE_135_length_1415_cov_315.628111_g105_i0.p3  ORF type:complete len:88 (-),score=16.99 NODE_135_length_1415_cov_315.628111_g105_i0:38-301(-)